MKIVALMGEAGSGKDTILHRIMEKYPSYSMKLLVVRLDLLGRERKKELIITSYPLKILLEKS